MPTFKTDGATLSVPLTQKQIAEEVGVSRQLVSFALRGQGRMSDEVRARILQLAESNGYDPYSNREARAMVSRRYGKRALSGILAVVFRTTFEEQPVTSVPYFAAFFHGLEAAAIERGLDLALCALRPDHLPRLVRDGQVDGVVGLLTPKELTRAINQLSLPVVNIMYSAPNATNLVIDDKAASAKATRHLLNLGHRRIAYIGIEIERALGRVRVDGYRTAMCEAGLPVDNQLIEIVVEPTLESGRQAVQQLLEKTARRPDQKPNFSALVCHNDLLAMGAIRGLREHGFGTPEDVSVVGFDDVSLQYSFQPELTSISFAREQMGRRAIELLCDQIAACEADSQASNDSKLRDEVFPFELVERGSTRPFIS